jgi:hypothetical protein
MVQMNMLLFYLIGSYFLLSNRILGIRYGIVLFYFRCALSPTLNSASYVKRTPRHLSFPLFPLRIVGILQASQEVTSVNGRVL